ncbi:uncharacterized protein LOC132551165 [Ylistrum balloti]|uniref:uncharacterized protein LOC132551165 n=1 Tax=Ylistrum balloti TaxID=509963 RepID=UPI002905D8BA|nr:uncharacterized protein LOC132551165 [Ylistrum balloti]
MFPLILLVLSIAMANGNVEEKPNMNDKIKELFNYGVTFEDKGTLYPSGNHWKHFFEIELQKFPFVSERPSPCSNCPWYSEAMEEILALHRQTAVDVGTILGEIKTLLPHHSLVRIPMARKRRSFLPFIGSLAKTLFGTATSSDLTSLSRNVALLRANQQKMAKATSHQIDIFTAAIRNFDYRIDNVFRGITDNHEAIQQLGENFNNSIITSQVAQARLLAAMTKQTRLALTIQTRFEELLMGVLATMQGKLSPLIIPLHTLTNVLSHMQSIVQPHGFYLTHSHPSFYYKHAKFTIFRRFSNILISVQFPITTVTLQLFKLNTFPIPLNKTTKHGTQLHTSKDHLLLSQDGNLFSEVSSKDLQSCSQSNHIWHCDQHYILRNDTRRSRLFSLFHGKKSDINDNCIFHFVQDIIQPSIIQLNHSHLVLINVSDITLTCKNSKTAEKGCSFCIIAIPCRCSLSSSSMYIDPYWNRCNSNKLQMLFLKFMEIT